MSLARDAEVLVDNTASVTIAPTDPFDGPATCSMSLEQPVANVAIAIAPRDNAVSRRLWCVVPTPIVMAERKLTLPAAARPLRVRRELRRAASGKRK